MQTPTVFRTTPPSSKLQPATSSARRSDARLMCVRGATQTIDDGVLTAMVDQFRPGDVFVVNDAATLPALLPGVLERTQQPIEIRLAAHLGQRLEDLEHWVAAVLSPAPWGVDTDVRPAPPRLHVGDVVRCSPELVIHVDEVLDPSSRLVRVRLAARDVWRSLYQHGHPIQYAYHDAPLAVWDQQTLFSGPAVAVEPPSSGFHLTWEVVFALEERGVDVVAITHGTGLSTMGDRALDAMLPLFETTFISERSAQRIARAHRSGGRIVAQGTGVVRALESMSVGVGRVGTGLGVSVGTLHAQSRRNVVDGILTGMHEPHTSHARLLASFVGEELVERAYACGVEWGYLGHEYGDLMLVWGGV